MDVQGLSVFSGQVLRGVATVVEEPGEHNKRGTELREIQESCGQMLKAAEKLLIP